MTVHRKTAGRRIRPRTAPAGRTGGRRAAPAAGTGREQPRRSEKRRLLQMTVSALLLAAVVLCKLVVPDVMERNRQKLLSLLGEDTDFTAVFSAAGRIVAPDGNLEQVLDDVYTAVFAPGGMPADDESRKDPAASGGEAAYTPENTPENVCLIQQVLGFPYAAPVEGVVTDRFGLRDGGDFHYGLDIAADSGAVIRAFAAGTVTVVGESPELGKYVTVYHGGDYATLYAHCSRITASSGQQVALGDPIAEVGQTGNATGPHLHFELTRDTVYLNPVYYVGR